MEQDLIADIEEMKRSFLVHYQSVMESATQTKRSKEIEVLASKKIADNYMALKEEKEELAKSQLFYKDQCDRYQKENENLAKDNKFLKQQCGGLLEEVEDAKVIIKELEAQNNRNFFSVLKDFVSLG